MSANTENMGVARRAARSDRWSGGLRTPTQATSSAAAWEIGKAVESALLREQGTAISLLDCIIAPHPHKCPCAKLNVSIYAFASSLT